MRIAFKILDKVQNVNSFEEVNEIALQSGNPGTLFFRLVNLEESVCPDDGQSYLRYIPATPGTSINVKFDNIDSTKQITRVASQPYPLDDRSIWSIPILATDKIAFDSMTVELTIGSDTYTLRSLTTISSQPSDGGRFYC